jgi:hypothetical protein
VTGHGCRAQYPIRYFNPPLERAVNVSVIEKENAPKPKTFPEKPAHFSIAANIMHVHGADAFRIRLMRMFA